MREKKGAMRRATESMSPAFSPTARMPSHNVITPASGSAISITPVRAESNVPSMIRLKTSASPRINHWASAAANETTKKPAQMYVRVN